MRPAGAGAVLLAVLCAAAAAAGLLAAAGGAVVVTHGVSMNPVYYAGDLVVVLPQERYAVGDIAAFRSPAQDTLVLHRIVGGDGTGFVFQGDNNESVDPVRPSADQLVGRAVVHLPGAGGWLQRLLSPPALAAYTFLLLLAGGRTARTRRQRRKERREMSPRHRAAPPPISAALPERLRPVAAGAALLGLAGVALSGLAWTRPAEQAVRDAGSASVSMDFSYTAQVPPSAAYDDTTVRAPQPVFRRLADTVDVSYRYAGPPGTVRVVAELSTAGGWRSVVPLSGTVRIADGFTGGVTLDLEALEQRAVEAAAATGLPVGTVTIAVVPTVELAAGGQFAPRLALSLDPLVVSAQGELRENGTATTAATRDRPAEIAVLGRGLDVGSARGLGAAMVLLSALAGGLLAAAARTSAPVAQAERIRRRYGDLILPVMPVVLTAGRPVVDVPDVDSLVKLAQRYGLLVLSWSRGGIDTYVVQDESTTYRYRSGAGSAAPAAEEQLTAAVTG